MAELDVGIQGLLRIDHGLACSCVAAFGKEYRRIKRGKMHIIKAAKALKVLPGG